MKLKNVLIIAMAIITLGLVVACSDDVVVTTKDNSQDYTQVLESNGAFVYNGKKYDSLKLVLGDIELGKEPASDPKVIKVTKNVKDKAATIGEDLDIVLDLGGHTLTFYDVKDNGLTVGADSNLQVKNGTLALQDKSKADHAVVGSDGAASLVFDGVTIDAAGQKTVDATNIDIVSLSNGSSVTGTTILTNVNGTVEGDGFSAADGTKVEGTLVASEGSVLYINNDMGAGVSLNSSTITVMGHAIIDSVSGDYEVNAADESAITNNTGSEIVVKTGDCYVLTNGLPVIYHDFEEALAHVGVNANTIVFVNSVTATTEFDLSAYNYNLTIDFNGKTVALSFTTSNDLTLKNSTSTENNNLTGTVTAAGLKVYDAKISGAVTSNGDLDSQRATFAETVTVTGDLTDGTNAGAYSNGSAFKSEINVNGDAYFYGSTLAPTEASTITASTVSVYGSSLAELGYPVYSITANKTVSALTANKAETNLIISASGGKAGNLKTTGNKTVDAYRYKSNILFEKGGGPYAAVSDISATNANNDAFGDVTIKGDREPGSYIDAGSISYAADVVTEYAIIKGAIGDNTSHLVGSLTDEYKSEFNGAINTSGKISLTNSTLKSSGNQEKFVYSESADSAAITLNNVDFYNEDEDNYAGVWAANGGSISMTNSTGTAYKVTATNSGSNRPGDVSIDNSESDVSFIVNDEVASRAGSNYGDVTIIGKSSNKLSVDKIESNDVTISKATVTGDVTTQNLSDDLGDVVSDNCVFDCNVTVRGGLTDGVMNGSTPSSYSTFNGAVSTEAETKVYGSTFTVSLRIRGDGANIVEGCMFNDATPTYATFIYEGTGTLTITNSTLSGNSYFHGGSTTVKNSSLGHYDNTFTGLTYFTGNAHVTFESLNAAGVYVGYYNDDPGNSTYVSLANGYIYVTDAAALGYASSIVDQKDNTDSVKITLLNDITLGSDLYLTGMIRNLNIEVPSYAEPTHHGIDFNGHDIYLPSPTGHYSLSGDYHSSSSAYIYYHIGAVVTGGYLTNVSLATY